MYTIEPRMGGVNHHSLHCRLAKFHGLVYMGKYGAMIGREMRFLYVPSNNFQAMGFFKPITAPCLLLYIKPWNFTKRQCKLQWLTPPTHISHSAPYALYPKL